LYRVQEKCVGASHQRDPLAIEANLAHAVKDANGRSYNRTKYLAKRFDQVQQWADYLDCLREGSTAIELHTRVG